MAILGELDRAGLLNRDCPTVLYPTLAEALDCCDVKRNHAPAVHEFYRAAPGGVTICLHARKPCGPPSQQKPGVHSPTV